MGMAPSFLFTAWTSATLCLRRSVEYLGFFEPARISATLLCRLSISSWCFLLRA